MTPYSSRPASLLTTLTRMAGVVMLIVGFAFCFLMIAATSAQAQHKYDAPTHRAHMTELYDETTHREHMTVLREWEGRYARGETMRIVSTLTARRFDDFPTHRARVRYVLSLASAAQALQELTFEREDAIAAGFCDAGEAEESSAFESLEALREVASNLRTEAVSLGTSLNTPVSRKVRRRLERGEVERFFKAASTLAGKDQRAMIIVDAFYMAFTTPELENESCRDVYGTDAFAAKYPRLFYTPSIGWPLPPKEE